MGAIVRRSDMQAKARRKGALAGAAGVGTAVAFVAGAPIVGVIGLAGAAYLGWSWLSYRMKHGLRM